MKQKWLISGICRSCDVCEGHRLVVHWSVHCDMFVRAIDWLSVGLCIVTCL